MLDKHADTLGDDIKKQYKFIGDLRADLELIISTWRQSEYIINQTTIKNKKYIQLIPKKIDGLSQHLFKYADKVILMSATFVDYKNYMRVLGIAEDDYKYIDLPSTFDAKKSPILFGNLHLRKQNLKSKFPLIVSTVKDILKEHKNEKGLIHTQSNVITSMLKENIKDKRILYRIRGDKNNEEILQDHMSTSKPTVLASPSMNFGVDLKGDSFRQTIIRRQKRGERVYYDFKRPDGSFIRFYGKIVSVTEDLPVGLQHPKIGIEFSVEYIIEFTSAGNWVRKQSLGGDVIDEPRFSIQT